MNELAKAGWLYRESQFLRRWKRAWFVLYVNGDLKYFTSPHHHSSEDTIVVHVEVSQILTGSQVAAKPPDGHSRDCLLSLNCQDGNVWTLCCESVDDMRAWELAIQEAKCRSPPSYCMPSPPEYVMNQSSPGSFPGIVHAYPGEVYYGQHPPAYTQQYASYPGGTTVVYRDYPEYGYYGDPRYGYYRRGYDGTDVAMGMVAGAAVGSLMMGPLLWW